MALFLSDYTNLLLHKYSVNQLAQAQSPTIKVFTQPNWVLFLCRCDLDVEYTMITVYSYFGIVFMIILGAIYIGKNCTIWNFTSYCRTLNNICREININGSFTVFDERFSIPVLSFPGAKYLQCIVIVCLPY